MGFRDRVRALPQGFWIFFLVVGTPVFFVLNFLINLISHSATHALEQAAVASVGWAVVVSVLLGVLRRRP